MNNAALGDWTATPDITLSQYDAVMNTNVRAPLFLVQAALPYIPRGGRIINMSSFSTRTMMLGDGVPPMGLYIASKIALEGLSQGWAAEASLPKDRPSKTTPEEKAPHADHDS